MRRLLPWVGGAAVLVLLWPVVCVSAEGGPTRCSSAAFPLPWGEYSDSWGIVVAIAAAVGVYVVLRVLGRMRHGRGKRERT